jgi:nitroreductase
MDLLEALYTTRAMRRMQSRDVPDDLIPRLLDAAIRAPSGGGFQNWCFIVIRDRATFVERFGQRPTWTAPKPFWS